MSPFNIYVYIREDSADSPAALPAGRGCLFKH